MAGCALTASQSIAVLALWLGFAACVAGVLLAMAGFWSYALALVSAYVMLTLWACNKL